ncbi:sugar-transfer associated ATP-grasp domain-containing protein [Vineibacter terrae]|uniref:sugar-transfer associated ATP-grasp domain-containing protein n=1 Tax=Vineibacter terrae TaxID=2586908 RepID=UPI002E346415|nr:sugar-transfer associated ATP-grasp domain-containing protein [Vineibacter terrae]HEX2889016.1 sugar-transfer associated ATP-grasp domain-containing protein [Vineibacter terrae]
MRPGILRPLLDQRPLARVIVALAVLYALLALSLSLLVPALADMPAWRADSPVEVGAAVVVLGGMAFAASQFYRHRRHPAHRIGWAFATVGMALFATSMTADWFSDSAPFWNEACWFTVPLGLVAFLCLQQCTRLYDSHRRVALWLCAGFAVQLVWSALDVLAGVSSPASLLSPEMLDAAVDYASLLVVLCYVTSLVMARLDDRIGSHPTLPDAGGVGVIAPRAATPIEVGALARALFFDQHLFRAARYPTRYPILHRPGLRQAVTLAMAAFFGGRIGPQVERVDGRPLIRQFRDLLGMGIAQGIDAVSYYLFELYRSAGRKEAPYYLTRYETKNGLFAVLNAARTRSDGIRHELTDKLVFGDVCARAGIPTPPILLSAIDGRIRRHVHTADLDRDLFAKLMRGRGTMKTGQFRRIAHLTYLDRSGHALSLADVIETVRRQSLTEVGGKTTPVIVQPRLRNHASLADLAKESLIVVRVVTCLDRDDEPEVTHAMLRVLAKIEPDWDTHPDWEHGAAIDIETGRLGWLTGDKPDTCLAWYRNHPVTGAPVLGRRIEDWPALRDLARRAHGAFRNRIVIGWDMALTTDGPMVIEGNSNMDVSFIQRAYRDPIGRSRLGELLAYHLSRLEGATR